MNKNTTTAIDIPIGTKSVNMTQENNKILLEFVSMFKNGDFLYSNILGQEDVLIVKEIHDGRLYFHVCMNDIDDLDFSKNYYTNIEDFRPAREIERQNLLSAIKESCKQWNAEKLCIEDIPQRKFKPGDKVKLKNGMRNKRGESPYFVTDMDVFIGKVLTIGNYKSNGYIYMNEAKDFEFAEDWLEPYEELKKGDFAIFWDNDKEYSKIGIYKGRNSGYIDHDNSRWLNAVKFESREQFLEYIKK